MASQNSNREREAGPLCLGRGGKGRGGEGRGGEGRGREDESTCRSYTKLSLASEGSAETVVRQVDHV